MTQHDPRHELGRATAQAALQLAAEHERIRFRRDPSPCPGDLYWFLSGENRSYLEWVIVGRDPDDNRRLLLVLVDDYPQVGSRDLALYPGAERVANARCDLVVSIEPAHLRPELRTGALPPAQLDRLCRRRRQITEPGHEPSLLEAEVDGDPEYRQWRREVLQPALAALRSATTTVVPMRRSRRWSSPALAIAASLLLVLSVASVWRSHDLQLQLGREQQSSADLEREQDALQQRLQESEAAAQAQQAQAESQQQESAQAIAELQRQLQATRLRQVEKNLSFAFLHSDVRRGPNQLVLEPGARRVALFVPVVDPEWYPGYRLQLYDLDDGSDSPVWSADDLVLNQAVLSVSLPAALLEPGDYELRLAGLNESGAKPLQERYRLEVSVQR